MPDRVLLTFTGLHDPFVPTATEGVVEAGPVLTVVAERPFEAIYLFSTPKTSEISVETKKAIQEKHKGTKVEILDVPLKDPTNYLGILRQLRKHFRAIQRRHPDAAFSISVSSGTPHMHASWVLLTASGEIPATLLQSTARQFVPVGKSQVREIDILAEDFPRITRTLGSQAPDTDEEAEIAALCHQEGIIGSDPGFLRALREAYLFGQYDDTHVLLLGETGSSGSMKDIGKVKMLEVPTPLPPIDLQNRFAALANKIQGEIANATTSLEEAESLFTSLQQRAFRGEL